MLCFQPINVGLCSPLFLRRNWKISMDYIASSIKGFKFETLLRTRVLLHQVDMNYRAWFTVANVDYSGSKIPHFKILPLFPLKTLSGISFSLLDILKGTKKLECTLPDGTGRRVIQNHLNYPFSIVSYADHFYHTDWRRDGVISVNKDSGQFTDEYLPEQRSHLYGITAVYPYCPTGRK